MEVDMRESLRMICVMARELRLGWMGRNMKGSSRMG